MCRAQVLHLLSNPDFYGIEDKSQEAARALKEFNNEATLLASLHNDRILSFVATVIDDATGMPKSIVMELARCNFRTYLDDLASRGLSLSLLQFTCYCRDILIALAHLHGLTPNVIVHRDLKPDNVLVFDLFEDLVRLKLGDVGLARFLANDNDTQSLGALTRGAGAMFYMAPEVSSGLYDPRIDVFSFGVMMSEVVLSYMSPERRKIVHDTRFRRGMIDDAVAYMETQCKPLAELLQQCCHEKTRHRITAVAALKRLDCIDIGGDTRPRLYTRSTRSGSEWSHAGRSGTFTVDSVRSAASGASSLTSPPHGDAASVRSAGATSMLAGAHAFVDEAAAARWLGNAPALLGDDDGAADAVEAVRATMIECYRIAQHMGAPLWAELLSCCDPQLATEKDVAQEFCRTIANLAEAHPGSVVTAGDGLIAAVMEVAGAHAGKGSVQVKAWKALRVLVTAQRDCRNAAVMVRGGVLRLATDALASHVTVSHIVEFVCGALEAILRPSLLQDAGRSADCVEAVLRALQTHLHEANVAAAAVGALKGLSSSLDNRIILARPDTLAALFSAMARHLECEALQARALVVLVKAVLTHGGAGTVRRDGISRVFAAMDQHVSSEEVQAWACWVLQNCCSDAVSAREVFLQGPLPRVFCAMRRHPMSIDVQLRAVNALMNLATATEFVPTIMAPDGLMLLLETLIRHPRDARVQEAGCAALLKLSSTTDDARRLVWRNGGIEVLSSAVDNCPGVLEVQQFAVRCFAQLARVSEVRAALRRAACEETAKMVLQRFPGDPVVKPHVDSLLKLLKA